MDTDKVVHCSGISRSTNKASDNIALSLKHMDYSYKVLLTINLGSSGAYEIDLRKIPLFHDGYCFE